MISGYTLSTIAFYFLFSALLVPVITLPPALYTDRLEKAELDSVGLRVVPKESHQTTQSIFPKPTQNSHSVYQQQPSSLSVLDLYKS